MAQCEFPNCRSNAVNGSYCIGHAKMMGVVKIKTTPAPIAKTSEKKKVELKQLKAIVGTIIEKGVTPCAINSPVCTGLAQAPEHTKGRVGKNLTDKKYLLPACNPCNGYLSDHPAWARENGFAHSRLKK